MSPNKEIKMSFNEAVDNIYLTADGMTKRILGSRIRDILMGTDHRGLFDAVAADIFDVIPIAGDLSNLMRIRDAAGKGAEFAKRRLPVQMVDLIVGILPDPIGGVLDLVTPSNIINYFERTGAAKWVKRA